MVELKVKDRVIVSTRVVPDPNQARGIVEEIYPREHDDVVIVRLDNKELIKCFKSDVTLLEEKEQSPATDTITITREDFRDISCKAISKLASESMTITTLLLGPIIGAKIETALFGDNVE